MAPVKTVEVSSPDVVTLEWSPYDRRLFAVSGEPYRREEYGNSGTGVRTSNQPMLANVNPNYSGYQAGTGGVSAPSGGVAQMPGSQAAYSVDKPAPSQDSGGGGGGGYMQGIAAIGGTVNNTMGFWKSVVDDYRKATGSSVDTDALAGELAKIALEQSKLSLQQSKEMKPIAVAQAQSNLASTNQARQQGNLLFGQQQQDRRRSQMQSASFLKGIAKGIKLKQGVA